MNIKTKLAGAVAALLLGLAVVAPVMADSTSNMNVELTDSGSFDFWLWNANLAFTDQSVASNQGATGRNGMHLGQWPHRQQCCGDHQLQRTLAQR